MKNSLFRASVLIAAALAPTAIFAADWPTAPMSSKQKYIHDLDPYAEARLNNTTHLEMSIAGAYIFDQGSDAKNQTGWGGSIAILALPPRDLDYENWQIKFGGEFYGFSTSGDVNRSGINYTESIDGGMVFLNAGLTYSLGGVVEIGGLIGTGMGGAYGETKGPSHKEQEGNWNYGFQIKPQISFHLNEQASFFVNYRIAYIGPVYDTSLLGYDTVTMIQQAVEVGFAWRF